ncbi:MAG: Ig-like domain-containing protein [Dethiobacteria bacterium]
MLKPRINMHKIVAFMVIFIIFLALTTPAASQTENIPAPSLNLTETAPARLIIQYIDGELYKWQEFDRDHSTYVMMLEPEIKLLSKAETAALFAASRRWVIEYQNYGFSTQSNIVYTDAFTFFENIVDKSLAPQTTTITREIERQAMVDNRTALGGSKTITYPYFNTGFLAIKFNNDYMRGSGFLISPYVVLTNAHNVYTGDFGGWFDEIQFSPAQYETVWPNAVKPFGTLNPVLAETNDSYIFHENNNDRNQSIKFDYAALFFNETFSGINTFVPLEFNYIPSAVTVIGYPGIVKDANTMGMWKADGSLISYDSHCLFYDAYTSGGSSGSPVLSYNQQSDTYRVVAVHSFASPGNFSGGPHLNDLNREMIEKWLAWTPQTITNPVTSLTLNMTNLALEVGDKEALIVAISPDDATNSELSWSSSNRSVARVDANGMVTAVAGGTATITVKTIDGSQSASCQVTVNAAEGETGLPGNFPLGDVNEDGIINVQDVALVMQHVLLITTLDDQSLATADVNGDGDVNVIDVTLLMQYSLGLINTF